MTTSDKQTLRVPTPPTLPQLARGVCAGWYFRVYTMALLFRRTATPGPRPSSAAGPTNNMALGD